MKDELIEQGLRARGVPMIARAIGRSLSVRLDPGPSKAFRHVVTGTIVAAEFARVRYCPRSAVAVFKVTLECGVNKVRREVHVSQLPR
jgi:hypothetical protein